MTQLARQFSAGPVSRPSELLLSAVLLHSWDHSFLHRRLAARS
jgi:hypothetical protein